MEGTVLFAQWTCVAACHASTSASSKWGKHTDCVWVSRGFWDGEGLTLFPANACLMKLTHKSLCEGQRRDFQHKFQWNLGSDADPLDLCWCWRFVFISYLSFSFSASSPLHYFAHSFLYSYDIFLSIFHLWFVISVVTPGTSLWATVLFF